MCPVVSPLAEALDLADQTLRALEFEELPLSSVAMRAARVARLLGDSDYEAICKWEVGGYPRGESEMDPEVWRLAGLANRYFTQVNSTTKKSETFAYLESIESLESNISVARERLAVAGDGPQRSARCGQRVRTYGSHFCYRGKRSAAVGSSRISPRFPFVAIPPVEVFGDNGRCVRAAPLSRRRAARTEGALGCSKIRLCICKPSISERGRLGQRSS